MSQPNHSTNSSPAVTNHVAPAESSKTQQAAAKATTESAEEMAPEKIVVEKSPPKPDYPRYRVHPGQPIP
ncbi:hypothetical protein [Leptolyngbya sp. FACHB-261]|uniref:hypothetical protein n=1 Tax=Leptolyngbya sp. FACHB-261 TaxID=2692806 RepID=UPI001684689D|nr:hypothetical protein [Leptolyngbya sp. FACHB-261]MBD2099975.1 hypothetical protein [Leptolyngbya sp. FACHB-261]